MSQPRYAIPPETRDKQRRASDPTTSAWVSANAGSGKTFVLTRRVVRLLLGGVAPSRILCLTFTKAAAANMAVKVFETLAAWVSLDDDALTAAILDTGAPRPGPDDLASARKLFARTVETPGGLKILTIHAFCEKLLHAFPFEANVAAGFAVIEELRQEDLLARAREAVLAEAVGATGSALSQALDRLTDGLGLDAFQALVKEVAGHRAALREAIDRAGGLAELGEALAAALGTGGSSVEAIERSMVEDGLPPTEWDSVGRHLALVAGEGHAVAEGLVEAAAAAPFAKLGAYLAVFFTQKLTPREKRYLSKTLRGAEPELCARLDAEQARLAALLVRRRAAQAYERTMALLTVAGAILDRYERLKRRAGLLDFADLIERSRALLDRSDSAWVLYKLDAGIDHILVDEAQDTSPDQWAILQAISRDFFAGEGASAARRTFFAVGDEKQSIYSFQGARPAMMRDVHADVQARARGAGLDFASIDLLLSFRSVRTVLDVVDRVFAHAGNARGLSAAAEAPPPHQALKTMLPGHVEIWPLVKPAVVLEPGDWRLPLDVLDASSPSVIVAQRVAAAVARLIAPGSGETVDAGDANGRRRPVEPGDVLILVRSRNTFFEAVIRALKERGVPVAGADRLDLAEHIATQDLIAAGRAALLPDDDLTLACLLKSPLIGLDDDDLMRLAPGRNGSLAAELRSSPLARDAAAFQSLAIWRERAATLTPFAFYTRLLGQDGGRRKLLGRLGPEAGDVIDEFVNLTLAHERDGAPSLLAFLARLETAAMSIKRDLATAGDAVRVMTVHAAKGLEARIVMLPDTCGAPNGQHDSKLFQLDDEEGNALFAWSPRAPDDPDAVAARRASEREAALDEHRRLLYVALTRAEERLYIAGFHGAKPPAPGCWYDMIVAASLGAQTTVPAPWNAEDAVVRIADPVPAAAPAPAAPPGTPPRPTLPDWLLRAAPPEPVRAPPIRPSSALGAADQPDRTGDLDAPAMGPRRFAALAGRLTHRLLQHLPALPPARRSDAAARFLARHGAALADGERTLIVTRVMAVLEEPGLAALFGEGSRAEVPIAATIARPGAAPLDVTGQIDRMAETATAVHIADFKTGTPRLLGDTSPRMLAQIALYAAAVAPLFPGKEVRACLVWTAGPTVVPVDPATLRAALDAIPPS